MASARVAALRYLKIRPRSIEEVKQKLAEKKFSDEEITSTIDFLVENRLLDDRAFTSSWIQYRLARPFGFLRIKQELKEKGVPALIIDEAIAQAQEGYGALEVALDLAQRRWKRFSGIDPQKKKKRVFDFLLRRGFTMDVVMKVIKKLQ